MWVRLYRTPFLVVMISWLGQTCRSMGWPVKDVGMSQWPCLKSTRYAGEMCPSRLMKLLNRIGSGTNVVRLVV